MASRLGIPKKIIDLVEGDSGETIEETRRLQRILTNLCYEGKPSLGRNLKQARQALALFSRDLMEHMDFEEKVTFPYLGTHVPKLELLISLLCSEHDEFRRNLRSLDFWLKELAEKEDGRNRMTVLEKVKELGTFLAYLLQNHLLEESEILYRVADQELRPDEKRQLVKRINEQNHRGR